MTIEHRPLSLLQEETAQSPMPYEQGVPADSGSDHSCPRETNPDINPNTESVLNLSTPDPDSGDDYLHHILIGSPKAVTDTINLLHVLHYVEGRLWTPLIAIREQGLRITPNEGEVLSYLVRQRPKR